MKSTTKLLTVLAICVLLFVILGFGYLVRAKYQMNEYTIQLGAALNAATLVNATETHTDDQNAVIASYQGRRVVIIPENYKALKAYLLQDHAMPPFGSVDEEKALSITICGESHLVIQGDKNGQGALIRFVSSGKSMLMHVSGGDIWEKILQIALEGRSNRLNLPLNQADTI